MFAVFYAHVNMHPPAIIKSYFHNHLFILLNSYKIIWIVTMHLNSKESNSQVDISSIVPVILYVMFNSLQGDLNCQMFRKVWQPKG